MTLGLHVRHRPAGAVVVWAAAPDGQYLPADEVFRLMWRLRGVTTGAIG